MQHLANWLTANEIVFAVLVTVGVAVLLVCCLECTNCSCHDEDDLFHGHDH